MYFEGVDAREAKTPGQLIKALLDDKGWTQSVLAVILGVDNAVVVRMIADKRPIEAAMALKLAEVFSVSAECFLDLQKNYQLAVARVKEQRDPAMSTRAALFGSLPIADMIKRGWLAAESVRDVENVEAALVKFFGVGSINEIEILPHAAKKTQVFAPINSGQLAWLYRVRQIAKDILVARYSPEAVRAAVEKLSTLRATVGDARHVPKILTECGIRYVIVESIGSAKIDGACFWLNDFAPVIGMSLRHDRIDNLWFVLRHEIEHVLQRHGRDAVMVDADLDGPHPPDIAQEERIANEAAAEFCVPAIEMQRFIVRKAPFFAERDVLGFARTLKVHPGLVAGQIRHKIGRYDRLTSHLAKIRSVVTPNAHSDGWGDVAPVE